MAIRPVGPHLTLYGGLTPLIFMIYVSVTIFDYWYSLKCPLVTNLAMVSLLNLLLSASISASSKVIIEKHYLSITTSIKLTANRAILRKLTHH